MSRSTKEIFDRLGPPGLARALEDLLDHNRLVRLANTCGLKYPGMRTQSQKRQRILSDLVKRAATEELARNAVNRILLKETRATRAEWASLSKAERAKRLNDDALLFADGNLGRHLFVVACAEDEEAQEGIRLLLERAEQQKGPSTGGSTRPSREELRLNKRVTELQKKIKHLESQLAKSREAEKISKRELMQRKGELAESRMLAERLQRDLTEARTTLRAPAKTSGAAESVEPLLQTLRKLGADHKKLVRRIDKRLEDPPAAAPLDADSVSPLMEALQAVQKEMGGLRRDRKKELQQQTEQQDELRKEVQTRLKAVAKPPKRRLVKGAEARVGVFIDVQNMYYAARQLKGKLDFDALMQAAVLDRRLIQATAYVVESKETDQSYFIALLQQRAIEVRRKTVRIRADGSMKGDWDMELALDILDAAPNLDVVVLVSGDGDFTSLVKRVKRMGPRVEVLGFPRNTAKSLLEAADSFQPLDRKFMIYPERPKNRSIQPDKPVKKTTTAKPKTAAETRPAKTGQ